MTKYAVVLDNVRSAHNVGALMRSAAALGAQLFVTTGLTPHIKQPKDNRLPHIIAADERKIAKTALGAQNSLKQIYFPKTSTALDELRRQGYLVVAVELCPSAVDLDEFQSKASKIALVLGHETRGLSQSTLASADVCLQIPMSAGKESLNVAAAGAIAMYVISRK